VSDLLDRRARKKAQTTEQIRGIAHRLFAERGFDAVTIADVAREADVAVQTVFNHFATKEELFFDGRVPWVAGPADAVRSRGTEPPLTALRTYLTGVIAHLVASMATTDRRCYVATVEGSETLRAYERELVFECERRLSDALTDAWRPAADSGTGPAPADPALAASLTAAVWLSVARSLVVAQRPLINAGACPDELAARVELIAAAVLAEFETSAALTDVAPDMPAGAVTVATGWPHSASRAG
jgi:AcrR family transcriptional regulator